MEISSGGDGDADRTVLGSRPVRSYTCLAFIRPPDNAAKGRRQVSPSTYHFWKEGWVSASACPLSTHAISFFGRRLAFPSTPEEGLWHELTTRSGFGLPIG